MKLAVEEVERKRSGIYIMITKMEDVSNLQLIINVSNRTTKWHAQCAYFLKNGFTLMKNLSNN